jgi:hypothetical protein
MKFGSGAYNIGICVSFVRIAVDINDKTRTVDGGWDGN